MEALAFFLDFVAVSRRNTRRNEGISGGSAGSAKRSDVRLYMVTGNGRTAGDVDSLMGRGGRVEREGEQTAERQERG